MPGRIEPFENDAYYHVYNRGVAKQPIFLNEDHYQQALLSLRYYRYTQPPLSLSAVKKLKVEDRAKLWQKLEINNESLVSILCFCLMPNHWHLLLRQNVDEGIPRFVSQFSNSYARYFNTITKRVGPVFQGRFKAVRITSEQQFVHLSRYIHINPSAAGIIKSKELISYPWSSLSDYLKGKSDFLDMYPILYNFSPTQTYKEFIYDFIEYSDSFSTISQVVLDQEKF